jgi:hypothetical protein
MLQAPGPRGSPHVPQPPGDAAAALEDDEDLVETANVESCFSRLRLWQAGHDGGRSPVTNCSNGRWQSRQTYSKSGMVARF